MKTFITYTGLLLFVSAITILPGCKKEESLPPPSVDVAGIWVGRWEGDTDTDHGNLLIELLQDESELSGEIFFREDLPRLVNSGVGLKGTVYGNEVSFRLTAGSEYGFHGIVDADRISGEIEYGAVWNANLMASRGLQVLDSFDCPGLSPRYIAVDSQKIWVHDAYDNNVIQMSKQSGIVEKNLFGDEQKAERIHSRGITSDGNYIYSSYNRNIAKIPINNPDDQEVINTPDIGPSKLCFDGEYFRVIDHFHIHIHTLSNSGELLSTYESYGLGHGIAFDGTYVWILQSSPKILIRYDDNGEILETCILPKLSFSHYSYNDLAYDGQNFWVLVSHFSPDLPNKEYLYKLGNV